MVYKFFLYYVPSLLYFSFPVFFFCHIATFKEDCFSIEWGSTFEQSHNCNMVLNPMSEKKRLYLLWFHKWVPSNDCFDSKKYNRAKKSWKANSTPLSDNVKPSSLFHKRNSAKMACVSSIVACREILLLQRWRVEGLQICE